MPNKEALQKALDERNKLAQEQFNIRAGTLLNAIASHQKTVESSTNAIVDLRKQLGDLKFVPETLESVLGTK